MHKTSRAFDPSFTASLSTSEQHRTLATLTEVGARVLLASLFLVSGLGKIGAYSAAVAYLASGGLPEAILPLVVVIEVLGAVALVLGWKTRAVAVLLAAFTLLAAYIFHSNFADPMQMINFLKNLAIAGGLLLLAANGPGPLSIDRHFLERSRRST
jgi:putative oxidoreductase